MPVYIQSIGTAVPPFGTTQKAIADFMVDHLNLDRRDERVLRYLYGASGIDKRYSVLEDFGRNLNRHPFFKKDAAFPSIKPRMLAYRQHALDLTERAINHAATSTQLGKVTHLITVSCTGMYAPGLDIDLVQRLKLKTHIERTAINFMGCYAAFNGLKLANQIVKADHKARVLIVCVELCSLHLQQKNDKENMLANAIFGDGAAAVVVGSSPGETALQITSAYSDLVLEGGREMAWNIGDHGFEMTLSNKVPDVIQSGISILTSRLLSTLDMDISSVDYFAIHPGGRRILDVIEKQLGFRQEKNKYAREVLRKYGNMSSPTILFVIQSIMQDLNNEDHGKHLLSFAFGPGLTLESMLFKIHTHAETQI